MTLQKITTMNALRQSRINRVGIDKASARLSSGKKINQAADDSAGLAISEGMRAQIRGLEKATQNISDGISLVQTADGAMNEISDMLIRIRELSVQSANDTNNEEDRKKIQNEINHLIEEIDGISNRTEFNTITLLNNSYGNDGEIVGLAKILGSGKIFGNGYLSEVIDFSTNPSFANNTTGYAVRIRETVVRTFYSDPGNPKTIIYDSESTDKSLLGIAPVVTTTTVMDGAGNPNYDEEITLTYSPIDNKYAGAAIDFSELGTKYQVSDLYNQGFNSTCATCSNHYSIRFTSGANSKLVKDSSHYILEIGIDGVTDGTDLVNRLMDALKGNSTIIGHYTQYTNDGDTLYLYDNRTTTLSYSSRTDTFSPIVYTTDAEDPPRNPLFIQVGANAQQGITFTLPWTTSERMGLNGLNVLSHDAANSTIGMVDIAQRYLNNERTKMGVVENSLEFSKNLAETESVNLSSAESRIKDADMAYEFMKLTKKNVLQQAAMSIMSNANLNDQMVLQLLRG